MVAKVGKANDGIGPRVWRYSDEPDEDAAKVEVSDAAAMVVGGPNQKSDPVRLARAMTTMMQLQLDIRRARNDPYYSADDPEILSDPATERVFWDGQDIVYRSTIVEIIHDGTNYVTKLRGARG